MQHNRLVSLGSICSLISLTRLDLEGNQLTNVPSPNIGNLKKLRFLYLNNNHLTLLPCDIGNLTNLENLRLESNNLVSLPSSIGHLKRLSNFNLSSNKLTSIPDEIRQIDTLQGLYLNVSNNLLISIPIFLKYMCPNILTRGNPFLKDGKVFAFVPTLFAICLAYLTIHDHDLDLFLQDYKIPVLHPLCTGCKMSLAHYDMKLTITDDVTYHERMLCFACFNSQAFFA